MTSFERIDKHTSEVSGAAEESFESLIRYLESGISPFDDRELCMARALILWFCMKHKEIEIDADCETFSADSPLGLIRQLKMKQRTFPEVFKMLCGKARIECQIIKGISRSGDYQPGDIDSRKLSATWNVVRISGQWRLVYPRWVVQSVKGSTTKGIVLEAGGKKLNECEEKCLGTLQKDFNDFWFLTDPSIFVNKCLPTEPRWQLLPMNKIQKSKIAFLKQPNYTEWAYKYGLRLVKKPFCILYSGNGFCLVELKADSESCMMELSLSFKLKLISTTENYDMSKSHTLVQYFPPTLAKKTSYGFKIRFPVEGKYSFEISAGPRKDRSIRHQVCDFMIVCKQRMKRFKPLPVEVGETGWAPGPDAVEAGLTEASISVPNVTVKPMSEDTFPLTVEEENKNTLLNEVAEFVFKVEKGVWKLHDYETVMFGSDFVEETEHQALQENVKTVNDQENCTLNIKASVPKEGEYALVIKTVPKENHRESKAVCNYMLTTYDTSSDEVLTDDSASDYSSDEEFGELKKEIELLRLKKKMLQETKNQLINRIQEQTL